MTFNQFIEKIMDNDNIYLRNDSYYDRNFYSWRRPNKPKKPDDRYYIQVDWTTGGMTGGSCWGGGLHPVDPEPPEELVDLDKILTIVCPNISFLQYKALCSELVKTESYTNSEYYGNYYNKVQKILFIDDLYSYLTEHKMLE